MRKIHALAAGLCIAALPACETMELNQTTGAIGGAALGGLGCMLSSANTTECALLVAGGALAGGMVGNFVKKQDQAAYVEARNQALEAPVGAETTYSVTSQETGNQVQTQVAENFVNDAGQTCRQIGYDYNQSGDTSQHSETYCKNAEGTWEPYKA